MKKIIFSVILFIALASFTIYSENSLKELIEHKLEAYSTKNYPEKIYLHTDKPFYSLDETIWFNSYKVNGIDHLKSTKSLVMHVDLINEKDSIMDSKKIFVTNITGAGDFKISKNWKPGKYLLRAYTNEMRNRSTDDFFQKEIIVVTENTKKKKEIEQNNTDSNKNRNTENSYKSLRPELNFYPEGGYLIEGLNNKIAVKITDPIFKNQVVKFDIIDNDENKIFSFKTTKFGLGLFMLIPKPGKTYTAIVDINGSEERYPLPKPLLEGYKISTVNNGKSIGINISTNKDVGLENTFLVAHQRGKHLFNKLETTNKINYKLSIPTEKLDDGIVHITLFNPEGIPVSERLVFVENPKNIIKTEVTLDKQKIKTREKITLTIDAKNIKGKSVSSSLSMSIRDMQSIPQNNFEENIKSYLLLNSDLRGTVENPGYFFEEPNDPKRRYLLDLTMMTNGWRKFTWQSLLYEKEKEKKYKMEKGIYIEGKTKALKKPYDYRSTATRLTFLGNAFHQEPQQSDSLGNFKYGPFIFFDTIPTLIEARLYDFKSEHRKNRNVVVLLNTNEVDKPKVERKYILQSNINDDEKIEAYLKISKYIEQVNLEHEQKMQQLDEVVIKARKKDEIELRNEEFDNRTTHGYADRRVITEDIIGAAAFTIYDLLLGVPGVNVNGNTISIRGGATPTFLLDDMPVDISFVESLTGADIDFIDVLTGAEAAIYADSNNGIIAIYSKSGVNINSKNIKRKPGIIDFKAEGYYMARTFFAPNHVSGFEEMSKADLRTTLHWEPNIRILPNKTAEVSFFSCDSQGDYVIDIQGISDSGIPFYSTNTFTVK